MKGSITKRVSQRTGAVSWMLKYEAGPRDPITKKRQTQYETIAGGTKRDAQKRLREILSQVDHGTHVDPSKVTLAEWCELWLRDIAAHRVSPRTLERYGELLRGYVVPRLGTCAVQKLATPAIQSLYSELRRAGGREGRALSARTVHHTHRVLFEVLKAAVRQRVINRNPAEDVDKPKPGDSPAKSFAPDQMGVVLNYLSGNERLPAIVRLAVATGMRLGELLALRWQDVDFDGRMLRVERSLEVTKKGGLRFKEPKTKRGRRAIRLADSDCANLRDHWKRQAEDALKLGIRLPRESLVFPASIEAPAAPCAPDRITKAFSSTLTRLDIKEPGLTFHSLRHFHATWLLRNGVNLKAVSERLGHANPSVTLNVYQHVLPDMQEHAAQVAGDIPGLRAPSR